MASFKVGARGEGAVSALLDIVQHRRERQEKQEDDFRAFRQRLFESGVKGELAGVEPTEELLNSMLSGTPFQGTPFRTRQPFSIRPEDLRAGESVSFRDQHGLTRSVRGEEPEQPVYVVDPQTGDLRLVGSVPGNAKLYSTGQGGDSAMEQLLGGGQPLAPAAPTPAAASRLSGFLSPPGAGADELDPIGQRIAQLRARGMADDEIAAALAEKGIDPAAYGL